MIGKRDESAWLQVPGMASVSRCFTTHSQPPRQKRDFLIVECARPEGGFLQLAMKMARDLGALGFRPDEQWFVILC